jgi:hypothetical protein
MPCEWGRGRRHLCSTPLAVTVGTTLEHALGLAAGASDPSSARAGKHRTSTDTANEVEMAVVEFGHTRLDVREVDATQSTSEKTLYRPARMH